MEAKPVEILSPAGSFESLQAAIHAGADAIYFGVEQLNMRTCSSDPFTVDDLSEVAKRCKAASVKAYLTLNTVMFEHDMQLLQTILTAVKKHGIDAVIAADLSVIMKCKALGIPIHVSTQANLSNIEAVAFFAPYADVVVLARELTLKQVAHICNEIKRRDIRGISGELIKIEIFVHGALCMAVSGKCYLSLHAQNSSANRGACTQNCRRSYTVTDNETQQKLFIDNEYILSPKDLCTISLIDQILDAGVSVLKIEGRSKGAEYVDTTTRCYKEAAAAVMNGTYTPTAIEAWISRLEKVYNRGFWEGYYLGRKLGEWTPNPGSQATEKKIYLGKGAKYYPKIQVGEFILESGSIQLGDTILITSSFFGIHKEILVSFRVNGHLQNVANKGDLLTFPISLKITPQCKLYKIVTQSNGPHGTSDSL